MKLFLLLFIFVSNLTYGQNQQECDHCTKRDKTRYKIVEEAGLIAMNRKRNENSLLESKENLINYNIDLQTGFTAELPELTALMSFSEILLIYINTTQYRDAYRLGKLDNKLRLELEAKAFETWSKLRARQLKSIENFKVPFKLNIGDPKVSTYSFKKLQMRIKEIVVDIKLEKMRSTGEGMTSYELNVLKVGLFQHAKERLLELKGRNPSNPGLLDALSKIGPKLGKLKTTAPNFIDMEFYRPRESFLGGSFIPRNLTKTIKKVLFQNEGEFSAWVVDEVSKARVVFLTKEVPELVEKVEEFKQKSTRLRRRIVGRYLGSALMTLMIAATIYLEFDDFIHFFDKLNPQAVNSIKSPIEFQQALDQAGLSLDEKSAIEIQWLEGINHVYDTFNRRKLSDIFTETRYDDLRNYIISQVPSDKENKNGIPEYDKVADKNLCSVIISGLHSLCNIEIPFD